MTDPQSLGEMLNRLNSLDDEQLIFISRHKEPMKDPQCFCKQYGIPSIIRISIIRSLKEDECIGDGLPSKDPFHPSKKWIFIHVYNTKFSPPVTIYIKVSSPNQSCVIVESFHEAEKETNY